MTEVLVRALSEGGDGPLVDEVAAALRAGALVLVPTETVYGVACRADDPAVLERLRTLKGEREGKPFARLVPDADAALTAGASLPAPARRLAERFWPGPLTLVLPMAEGEPVGFRVPGLAPLREALRRAEVPVVATSANRSGQPAPATFAEALAAVGDGVDLALDGGAAPLAEASTVVRVPASGPVEILREGFLSRDGLAGAPERLFVFVCTGNTCRSPMAAALFRAKLAEAVGCSPAALADRGLRVESAGVAAGFGAPAADHAQVVMAARGLDLTGHRSRPADGDLVDAAELIVALTPSHAAALVSRFGDAAEKVVLLDPSGVPDPIGGSLETYGVCADHIARRLDLLLGAIDLTDEGASPGEAGAEA